MGVSLIAIIIPSPPSMLDNRYGAKKSPVNIETTLSLLLSLPVVPLPLQLRVDLIRSIIVLSDGKFSSVYTSVIWTIVNLDLPSGHGSIHVGTTDVVFAVVVAAVDVWEDGDGDEEDVDVVMVSMFVQ